MMIVKKRFPNLLSTFFCNSVLSELYEPKKTKQTKNHGLMLFVSQDVGVCLLSPADELVTRSRRQILPWSHTDCTPFPGP